LQAFIDGQGTFQFLMSDTVNIGKAHFALYSRLELAQNSHDIKFWDAIMKYLGNGFLKPKYDINSMTAAKLSRSVNRYISTDKALIIDFLNIYPLLTLNILII